MTKLDNAQCSKLLSDLDSWAAVKSSRDPLGIQQVWTRMGRHVVGNLITVSNSVRDFSTVLLGFYFAEQLADERGLGSELVTFLKWEQLAAYSRGSVNGDFSFRGTAIHLKCSCERRQSNSRVSPYAGCCETPPVTKPSAIHPRSMIFPCWQSSPRKNS